MSEATGGVDRARCGSVIASHDGRDVVCDLPQGHPDCRPCRPSVEDLKAINRGVIKNFRAPEAVDGLDRESLILLTTLGARTGRPHTTPVACYPDHDRLLIVASNLAAEKHPNWYLNLVANPLVTVEAGKETYRGVATPLVGEDRDRAWSKLVTEGPHLADHQASTARTLPVVAITRAEPLSTWET